MYVHLHEGCTFFIYTFHFSLLHASFLRKLQQLSLNIFLDCWEVWYVRYANHPFYVLVIHILQFHYLEDSASTFGKCLGGSFTLLYMILQLFLYPNGYGVFVLGVCHL